MKNFTRQDLSGAVFRDCDLNGSRFVGVELNDVDIDGDIGNLTVNGVEVTAYVEAELDRRHPERVLSRSSDPTELLSGWGVIHTDWLATVERVRGLSDEQVRTRVDEEWSALETLRHTIYATDAWLRRAILGEPEPLWPGGLAWDTDFAEARVGIDPGADPSLEETLTVWADRAAQVTVLLESADATRLESAATGAKGPGWPTEDMDLTVGKCIRVVLNEMFWHRRFCVRDLDRLAAGRPGDGEAGE